MKFALVLGLVMLSLQAHADTCADKLAKLAERNVPMDLLSQAAEKSVAFGVQPGANIVIADMRPHIGSARLHVIELATSQVISTVVTHGKGSDTDGDGFATEFTRGLRKQMTELGLYRIPQTPIEHSYKIVGLEESNSTAQKRGVSFEHCAPAATVPPSASYGSFCIPQKVFVSIEAGVSESLLYAGLSSPEAAPAVATNALCGLLQDR